MDLFPLQIFPPGGLDSSVITTVWIGVFVVATFNLRFGWVLSGLVVPGYLVPLLIAKPLAAGVVLLEAVLTYGIVAALAGPLARIEGWGGFFGRDRFFALVLVSVAVRLVLDAWLLVELGEWLARVHDINFDYRNNLHSFGLIIIALIANQFWKTGLARGLIPLIVTVGLTFLIVRYGLMEFTNFRISGLSYMFEDVTASILAGPKAYIILLTTAFVASRMNLFYGWEFNGILIPSLLALQWYEPTKILTSFLEAFLVLGIGAALMQLPALRSANIEGARKLLLFFNVAFLWKLLLGWLVISVAPQLKTSDYFAFGYLLSTLMAIKMHDKGIALRLTWSTLTTSAVAIVIASIAGFALTLLPSTGLGPEAERTLTRGTAAPSRSLVDAISDEKRRMYAALGSWTTPLPNELEAFRVGVAALADATDVRDPEVLRGAGLLTAAGYEVLLIEDRHLLLREIDVRGWGTYVITPDATARALGGPRRSFDRSAGVLVLEDRSSPYLAFHVALTGLDAIHVRGSARQRRRHAIARVVRRQARRRGGRRSERGRGRRDCRGGDAPRLPQSGHGHAEHQGHWPGLRLSLARLGRRARRLHPAHGGRCP